MATNYTFSVSLLNASPNPDELQLWQSGTLTLDTSSSPTVTGALALPGYYQEPIAFTGSEVPPETQAGTIVVVSGQSSEAQIECTFPYRYDGFLYDGSYLGGIVSLLDYSAQETYTYVIQGFSPQGPFGGAESRDKEGPASG
jgi:hypothetical protein